MPDGLDWVASALGATIVQSQRVTSLWGGYGELLRVELEGFSARHAVVKWVRPPAGRSDRSHRRKHRSYEVETAWYRTLSSRCDDGCRVARLYASRSDGDETLLVLEDLDASGFAARRRRPAPEVLDRVLVWLASFHARFLGTEPEGLWPVGSYWHLATRPDELAQMSDDRLKAAAEWLDQKLRSSRFRTLIHGDAKLANFCFAESHDAVAAVDFQYVGGGCGMQDVAYLLTGDVDSEAAEQRSLNVYFAALRSRIALEGHAVDADALEDEWRRLYPIAWLDFQRFLAGWAAPSWPLDSASRARTTALLTRLGR